ncbi:HOG (high osmolarity glycerol) pathway protein [Exophiala xenobiotica]|uniref:HOG (High osmolarity glycerol) pathway protein n=1 Tax=Lithohypha guttulata TaxID=1690604 RepID=A0ABR0KHF3_9EURO|nr:HOG (high osmolarity glycerol) pathway protein [Lithohypha guttulata]KAK5327208.1 HOG (high osmolarity glycerol) pathway protein [Exophiala xenobiotica]
MATITESQPSPSHSPQLMAKAKSPALPPLTTNPTAKRTNSGRPTSFAQRRISSYSTKSRTNDPASSPVSQVFPAFHSSLSYTFPEASGGATPASERSRRLSDPAMLGWEDSRSQWSATPPWLAETNYNSNRDQLPAMTFNDGGPPYSEDEDLRSPVVTSKSRHKKSRSNTGERGRSPGAAGADRGFVSDAHGDQLEDYHPNDTDDMDGPGGEIETHSRRQEPRHRDSNFAKPLQRLRSPHDYREALSEEDQSEGEEGEEEEEEDETRYSKDYSFTIASPDEEMHGKAVALFDFVPEHENELALQEGQIILVSYRHGQGWLVAEDPQSGESGLVPEEFVRLVRHIEGGLNGLHAMHAIDVEDGGVTPDGVSSPSSNEPTSATTPNQETSDLGGHTPRPSNGGTWSEKHPAVQSNFSTSSRDFSPLKKEVEARSPDKE